MARVFVSHAGSDLDLAEMIAYWLRDAGHRAFLDRDLEAGRWSGRQAAESRRWYAPAWCLVTINNDGQPTRRRADLDSLPSAARGLNLNDLSRISYPESPPKKRKRRRPLQ